MTTVYNVEEVRTGFAIVEDEISSCTIASSICLHHIPQSYLILGTYLMRCVYRHILRIMPTSLAAVSAKEKLPWKYRTIRIDCIILGGGQYPASCSSVREPAVTLGRMSAKNASSSRKSFTQCEVVPAASFQAWILLSNKWKEVTVMY
jgi:hypothetical protein